MLLQRLVFAALLGFAAPVAAETTIETPVAEVSIKRLGEVMQFDELFEALREEGLSYGEELEADMFPSGGGQEWKDAVSRIYDVPLLRAKFNFALRAELASDPATLQAVIDFFASDLGQRIVGLEIAARRAFIDDKLEDAARVAADDRAANRDPKVALIRRMIESCDLLEMNVAGALTGNLAFMTGMSATGAYGTVVPEDQIMSDIWAQEQQIREDTSSWLYAFLGLAYDPLTEAELETYIDFFESPAGQRLNAAIFVAYDKVFRQVSHDLGRAAGLAAQGMDI